MAIRLPLALQLALLVTLGLFWAMWRVINQPIEPVVGGVIIHGPMTVVRPELIDTIEPPHPPVLLLPPVAPTGPGFELPQNPTRTSTQPDKYVVTVPPVTKPQTGQGGRDHDAISVVSYGPMYPPAAAARGIEGWVVVEYTVSAAGAVMNPKVVDSRPARTFDKAALEAVSRWRYNPRVAGGEAVTTVGLQARIRFELDKAR